MTTSPGSRRTRYALVLAVCAVIAVAVGGVLLWPGGPADRAPDQVRLVDYSLVKTGGIAGVRHHTEVSADGTALFVDERPVAGRLPQRSVDRLGELLSDRDLAEERDAGRPGSTCADAFTYTLTVGRTQVSKEDCGGRGDTPILDEVIGLTTKDDLRPLPAGAPEFRGLDATYVQMWRKVRAKVRIDADGTATVTKNGGTPRRSTLDTGTLDALRLLYAEPLTAPKDSGGVSCVPEQVPRYQITPEGRPTVEVSPCGRQDDHRWVARLRIIGNLVGD